MELKQNSEIDLDGARTLLDVDQRLKAAGLPQLRDGPIREAMRSALANIREAERIERVYGCGTIERALRVESSDPHCTT
jgi:hypothetical protein